MFHLNYPIHNLHPAPYNPRFIDDAAFQSLCESIRAFGMLKPIIVAEDGTIVAGHQRLRAVQAMGMTEVPVYVVKDLTKAMEMLFNQLHNGTDLDTGDEHVRVPPSETAGYHDVAPQDITGNLQASGAPVRTEIFKLLISHGPWGGIVANQSGTCLSGAQYAICCKHLGMPCRTFYVPDADTQRVRALFQKSYGQFYYAKLPKTTYAQTFAQPYRCRNDAAGQKSTAKKSSWDLRILPEWQPGERILDFGCGQADYIKKFRRERPDLPIWGVEFFFRNGDLLDTQATHRMCDAIFEEITTNGLFDIVVADYVINSVDSVQAEESVVACLNAFCKPGGKVYFSGRRRDFVEKHLYTKTHRRRSLSLEFLDQYGFRAALYKGNWLYQLFHTRAQACKLAERFIATRGNYRYQNHSAHQFNLRCVKSVVLPDAVIEDALRFEFDLMWPDGKSVGKAEEAVAAWRAARQIPERRYGRGSVTV